MRRSSTIATLFAAFLLIPLSASAQSAQRFSLQFSGLGSVPFGGGLDNVKPGPGVEAQLRINPSLWSFGFGAEMTFHDHKTVDDRSIRLLGGFFEPRRVVDIGSDRAAPYFAMRLAVSQTEVSQAEDVLRSVGLTVNGGGGLLIRMGGRTNLDLGATVGWKKLGIVTFPDGSEVDNGTGVNLVTRLGLAIGLGS